MAATFEDPAQGLWLDPRVLAQRAGITQAAARKVIAHHQIAQRVAPWKKPADWEFAPTGGPEGEYLGDVIFLRDYKGVNDGAEALLTLLESNTRYVYARPLTNPKARTTAAALQSILDQNAQDVADGVAGAPAITSLRVDGGGEFRAEFAALAAARGIPISRGEPNTHYRLGRLDRFHKTLRDLIGRLMEKTGGHRWVHALPALIANYNSKPHRGLRETLGYDVAPRDVGPDEERALRHADSERAARVRAQTNATGIAPPLLTRVLLNRWDSFRKSEQPRWSEPFPIVERVGPNAFRVDTSASAEPLPSVWPLYAMRVVRSPAVAPARPGPPAPRVRVPVVRAQRLEAQNADSEEQIAARGPANPAAAPAGPRARRAPRRYED